MARIFISHSGQDEQQTLRVRDWLVSNGWDDIYLDLDPERGVKVGERWQEALRAAAFSCELVIFLVSNAWASSPFCVAEYLLAKQMGKRCVPVLIEADSVRHMPPVMASEHQAASLLAADGFERLRRGLKAAGVSPETFEYDPARGPYPGLRALSEHDAAVFFGREAQIVAALDALRRMQATRAARLFLILGASGSGKSSLMRAGLWPRLRRDTRGFLPLPVVRPERAPLSGKAGLDAALETALTDAHSTGRLVPGLPRAKGEVRAFLRERGGRGLGDLIGAVAAAHGNADEKSETPAGALPSVVLPIDQMEELWGVDVEEEADELVRTLDAALQCQPRLLIVGTIRSQSYPVLQAEPRLAGTAHELFTLGPMLAGSFRSIVERPAVLANIKLQPELLDRLLTEASGQDALSLLAFILERLYREFGRKGEITSDDYQALGGVGGALQVAATSAFTKACDRRIVASVSEAQAMVKRVFIPHLVRVDDRGEYLRRVARVAEIPADARPMMELLADEGQRLLVRDRSVTPEDGATKDSSDDIVEVSHEVVLREWRLLQPWLIEQKEELVWRERVNAAWTDRTRSTGADGVLSSLALEVARRHEHDWVPNLPPGQPEFVSGLLRADEAARKRAQRTRQIIYATSVVTALIVAVLGGLSWFFGRRAADAGRAARDAALVRSAAAVASTDPRVASLLLGELDPDAPPDGALAVASEIARSSFVVATIDVGRWSSPTFSESGNLVVFLDERASAVKVWRSDGTGEPREFRCEGESVSTIATDLNDAHIAIATRGGSVCLWQTDGNIPKVLKGHSGVVQHLQFSSDGRWLASVGDDGTTRIVEMNHIEQVQVLGEHTKRIRRVAFSRDSTQLVTASYDGSARVWRVGARASSMVLGSHAVPVMAAEFSPDMTRVVTVDANDTARVWDATTGRILQTTQLKVTDDRIQSVRFGWNAAFVSIAYEKTVHFVDWNSNTVDTILRPDWDSGTEIRYDSRSISISADGGRVAATNGSRTVRVWDRDLKRRSWILRGHTFYVADVVVEKSGNRVLALTANGIAWVWRIGGIDEPTMVADSGRIVGSEAALDLIVSFHDSEFRVHSLEPPQIRYRVQYPVPIERAVTSADQDVVALMLRDNSLRVLRVSSRSELGAVIHQEKISDARVSPNGTHLLTVSEKGGLSIRGIADLNKVVELDTAGDSHELIFSPDGRQLLDLDDVGLRVWDTDSGKLLASRRASSQPLIGRFSADGRRLIVVMADGSGLYLNSAGSLLQSVELAQTPLKAYLGHVAVSEFGEAVVVWNEKGGRLWRPEMGNSVIALEGACRLDRGSSTTFGPGARYILRTCVDLPASLWRPPNVTPIRLTGEGGVVDAGFSADGSRLMTVSHDGPISVWNTASSSRLLDLPAASDRALLTADGKRVVARNGDGLFVWRVDSAALLQSISKATTTCFTAEERVQYLGENRAAAELASATCNGSHGRKSAPLLSREP